jgi:WD40 repeat protein
MKVCAPMRLGFWLVFAVFSLVVPPSWLVPPLKAAPTSVVVTSGHSGPVAAFAFEPHGTWFATASYDNVIKLWDTESGRLLRTLHGHKQFVDALAISPDGMTVVSSASDGDIKIWNSVTGELQRTIRNDGRGKIVFSADGRSLYGKGLTTIRRWDVATGALLHTYRPRQSVVPASLAVSSDEKLVASGQTAIIDCTCVIDLWDTSGRRRLTWKAHTGAINGIAFSPDGQHIASASGDKTVKLWETATGRLVRQYTGHSDAVSSVVFSPDGSAIISTSHDRTTRYWSVTTGQVIWSSTADIPSYLAEYARVDGHHVIASGGRGMNLVDQKDGTVLRKLAVGAGEHYDAVVVFTPDGNRLVTTGAGLTEWDSSTGQLRNTHVSGEVGRIANVAQSPDGKWIVPINDRDAVMVWDLHERKAIPKIEATKSESGFVFAFDATPDARRLVTSTIADGDNPARIWDIPTGKLLHTLPAARPSKNYRDPYVNALTISPDNKQLATAAGPDRGIRLWDIETGKLIRTIGNVDTRLLAFAADGKTILADEAGVRSGESVKLWDAHSGRLIQTFNAGFTNNAIAITKDGRLVASLGSLEQNVKIFDGGTSRLVFDLDDNPGTGKSLAFSPDGRQLVAANYNGTVAVWSTDTGRLLTTTLQASSGEWITITPEGFFAASAKGAQLVHVTRGMDTIGIDQFFQSLYRPDLVREKLAGDPTGLVREAAAKLDLDKLMESGPPPVVSIVTPASGGTSVEEKVSVEARISDAGGGIGRVEWRVNGTTLALDARGLGRVDETPAGPDNLLTLRQSLWLQPGENEIDVVAYNAKGLIASEPARIIVTYEAPATRIQSLHVLSVGVNDYWDSRLRLNFASIDATAIGDALRRAAGDVYQSVEITTLLDNQVTREGLDRAFADLSEKVRPGDVFVFFLAGHGKTVDGRYYFIPQDFRFDGENSIVERGIDQETWQAWFARIAARKSVLLYDTCESGSLTGDGLQTRGLERVAALDRMTQAMGRTMLSAATDDAPALEGFRGHGVFTYALLDAISRADDNGNELIEITEIASHVDAQVPEISFKSFGFRQVPQMKLVGSNFALVRSTAVLSVGSTQPAEPISSTPSHVVIVPADLYDVAGGAGAVSQQLAPGTLVTLLRSEQGWALVGRDGKALGFVRESTLLAAR